MKRVTVVVVSYETRKALLRCLDSVRRHADLEYEVRVVDNASTDGSVAAAFAERQFRRAKSAFLPGREDRR